MARLLDQLVAAWPTDIRRIALVGQSMGGLIMRAARAVVTDAETQWNTLVSFGILNLRGGLAPDVRASRTRATSATERPRRGREMFPGAGVLHVPEAGPLRPAEPASPVFRAQGLARLKHVRPSTRDPHAQFADVCDYTNLHFLKGTFGVAALFLNSKDVDVTRL